MTCTGCLGVLPCVRKHCPSTSAKYRHFDNIWQLSLNKPVSRLSGGVRSKDWVRLDCRGKCGLHAFIRGRDQFELGKRRLDHGVFGYDEEPCDYYIDPDTVKEVKKNPSPSNNPVKDVTLTPSRRKKRPLTVATSGVKKKAKASSTEAVKPTPVEFSLTSSEEEPTQILGAMVSGEYKLMMIHQLLEQKASVLGMIEWREEAIVQYKAQLVDIDKTLQFFGYKPGCNT